MKVAVSGKGGVGKTLVAGGIAVSLAEKGLKTIGIDADPSPNLALTLGLPLEETRKIMPISRNKELVESKTSTEYSGVYRLTFKVDDIIRDYSVNTPFNVRLMIMGTVQAVGSGCTCPYNAVIRELLRHLVVESDEAVVVDMEAGVEHLGRGTAQNVDAMLVISDANMKSLEIARQIYQLTRDAGIKQVFLVGNKVANDNQKDRLVSFAQQNQMPVLDFVPFDRNVEEADISGKTPFRNKESAAVQVLMQLGEKLEEKLTVS